MRFRSWSGTPIDMLITKSFWLEPGESGKEMYGIFWIKNTTLREVFQPQFEDKRYITSFLFKLKSKPAALYQSLGGFAINGVNLTKLQSYPEQNSFESYFFLCDLDGHIEDPKVQKSLEELGLHCQDFHVLGVFEADKFREK